MTAALKGGEWSAARSGRTLAPERHGTHFTGGWVGPRAGLDWRKISSTPGSFFLFYSYMSMAQQHSFNRHYIREFDTMLTIGKGITLILFQYYWWLQ